MDSNQELVNYLKNTGRIRTERVEDAFRNVDRKLFVPAEHHSEAYRDHPLPIGKDATISAPHMVAINTELLEVEEDSRVLEIGSGSGYQLAILAELGKQAVGVEIDGKLVERSKQSLEASWDNTEVFHGSGFVPGIGRFDRILFSCAVDSIEDALDHLEEDGVVVAPVGENGKQRLKKWKNGELTDHGPVRFVSFR